MNREDVKKVLNTLVDIATDEMTVEQLEKIESILSCPDKKGSDKRWRAKEGNPYWHVNVFGSIKSVLELCDKRDDYLYSTGNYFETDEDAKQYAIARWAYMNYASMADRRPDEEGYICYCARNSVGVVLDYRKVEGYVVTGFPVFSTVEKMKDAIEEAGEDDLIYYFRHGVI